MVKQNLQSTIDNRQSKAFTIVELLVAMSLLVMLLGLSGMVFNTTVAAHRAAGASIDVSRNLRAITEQLNTDFRGLRKDAPLFIAFEQQWVDANGDSIQDADELSYYDRIHFFADGDFQTMRQYDYDNDTTSDFVRDGIKTIYSNMARIYYGHANSIDLVADPAATPDYDRYNTLSRKAHLLTSDGQIKRMYFEIPEISDWPNIPLTMDYGLFDTSFGETTYTTGNPPKTYTMENGLEFNTITLTNWTNALNYLDAGSPDNANHFIANCMTDNARPFVDLADINTLHLLLSQGILKMQIQWAYTNDDLLAPPFFTGIRWWPSVNPDGDSGTSDSDFDVMADQFGVYLEMLGGTSYPQWFDVISADPLKRCRTNDGGGGDLYFKDNFYPKALKFTFVFRDSNGVFADGKTFTHIVYLDN